MFLLAAADMLLVSLLPRSIDRCRNDERDLYVVGKITIIPARTVENDVSDVERSGSTVVLRHHGAKKGRRKKERKEELRVWANGMNMLIEVRNDFGESVACSVTIIYLGYFTCTVRPAICSTGFICTHLGQHPLMLGISEGEKSALPLTS